MSKAKTGESSAPASGARSTHVDAYLFFDGRCEEAVDFYRRALGAEVTSLHRYKENPEPHSDGKGTAESGEKIMHVSFRIGDTTVFASDGHCEGKPRFAGFALSIAVKDEAEADQRFSALADGGQVQMPLGKTFFAQRFGMVTDRFGVMWMIICSP